MPLRLCGKTDTAALGTPPILLMLLRHVLPRPKLSRYNHTDRLSPLAKIIHSNIKSSGPISYAAYMNLCLTHPTYGYYTKQRETSLLGRKGDFITSPEISQVFGELLAIWSLKQWMDTSAEKKIRLIELGPGKGTLMADVLRVFSAFPRARTALKSVHLVEMSEPMRKSQAESLKAFASSGLEVSWVSALEEIPHNCNETFTMLLAHEFFDALPIHILQNTESGWREVLINSSLSSDRSYAPKLVPMLSRTATPASYVLPRSSHRFSAANYPHRRVEISPSSARIATLIATQIRPSGCALIIDYGSNKAFGDSFRGFKEHKLVEDPLQNPGECDLTANVDFAYLQEAILSSPSSIEKISENSLRVHGSISQAEFLTNMGLSTRVETLIGTSGDTELTHRIQSAAERLISLTGMGRDYAVMGVTCDGNTGRDTSLHEREVWPFVGGLE